MRSDRIARRGQIFKVATIILGAFSASQAVAVRILGHDLITLVTFALVGIAISTLAGIDAAFKFETHAADLRTLAAKCQAARFQHNSEWANKIAIAEPEKAICAARNLLELQDRTVSEVQIEAAKLGISIALDTRQSSDSGADVDADFPPPASSNYLPDDPSDWLPSGMPGGIEETRSG